MKSKFIAFMSQITSDPTSLTVFFGEKNPPKKTKVS